MSLDDDDTKNNSQTSSIVKLNIGGQKFTTSKATLKKCGYFSAILSGNFKDNLDEDGSHFIDRNGKWFEYILDYLRSGITIVPKQYLPYIKVESDFYQIKMPFEQTKNDSDVTSRILVEYIPVSEYRDCACILVDDVDLRNISKRFDLQCTIRNIKISKYRSKEHIEYTTPKGKSLHHGTEFVWYLVTRKNYNILHLDEVKRVWLLEKEKSGVESVTIASKHLQQILKS